MNHFSNISKDELELINGGGLAGAAAGYLVGVVVGGILAVAVCCDKGTQGSPNQGSAVMTVFTSAVITCTTIGAAATGII